MYLAKTPGIVKPLGKHMVWRIPTEEKKLYFTFDDGPHPDITPEVLRLLDIHNAKGTFFCVGNNAEKHPHVITSTLRKGHSVGHHTWSHVNGWKVSKEEYLEDVKKVPSSIHTKLFRPPYGRISRSQAKALSQDYSIIMWDVLSGDFDPNTSREKCLRNVMKNVEPGSIVVFHDSEKAKDKMLYALENSLILLSEEGYQFEAINPEQLPL